MQRKKRRKSPEDPPKKVRLFQHSAAPDEQYSTVQYIRAPPVPSGFQQNGPLVAMGTMKVNVDPSTVLITVIAVAIIAVAGTTRGAWCFIKAFEAPTQNGIR